MAQSFATHHSMTNHGGIILANQMHVSQMGNLFGSRLADLHLVLPNEVPQLCC